jgi:hypothetical protein
MGQLGALGRPGRARRVEDHRSISVLAHDGFHKGLGCADHLLEVARGDHDALGAGGLGPRLGSGANACHAMTLPWQPSSDQQGQVRQVSVPPQGRQRRDHRPSQSYETKESARKGIESVKTSAAAAKVVDLTEREPAHN